jgi:phosphatidate cytidylyltransferase
MDNSTLTRISTGFVLLAAAVLLAIADSPFVTWATLGLIYMIAFYEACKLFNMQESKVYVLALALWIVAGFFERPEYLSAIVILGLVALMVHKKEWKNGLILPFFYPTIPMLFLLSLYYQMGMPALIWLVLIVALTDTGAYVIGKSFGKTPFSPSSPNKTWEGVGGGVAVATVVGTIFGLSSVGWMSAFSVAFLTSVASVWGDLYESFLKREAGVKDSGTIFPGHGGMLDRIDGYLFGGIVMVVILQSIL